MIIVYLVPVVLVSVTFHEVAHAYCSYKLGDPTAKNMGRITLNPLKHLDILGTIMILVSGFGWAKPVPINPMYYKDRKKGTMLVGIAGPLSNILLALLFSFPMAFIGYRYGSVPIEAFFNVDQFYFFRYFLPQSIVFNLSRFFYIININLAVFNILPVPPLDGSRVLSGILPQRQYFKLLQYENYIAVIFLLIIFIFPGILYKVMFPFIWLLETAIRFIAMPLLRVFI
ncbi:MAG: site-2 protease family protein [Firmicutes bacterium]|nr:site-2 protease family protein [Bacillota bacterium]